MQIGAVHGIGEVVERIAVIAVPRRHAQDRRPFRIVELRRQLERQRRAGASAREVDEDRIAGFGDRKALRRTAALERTVRHRRHPHDGAAAVEGHAVIAAGDVVANNLAARQPGAAMRTIILEAVEPAVAAAPQHQVASQCPHRMRPARLDLHRLRHRVPLVEQAAVDQVVDLLPGILGHGTAPVTCPGRVQRAPLRERTETRDPAQLSRSTSLERPCRVVLVPALARKSALGRDTEAYLMKSLL